MYDTVKWKWTLEKLSVSCKVKLDLSKMENLVPDTCKGEYMLCRGNININLNKNVLSSLKWG